MLQCEYQIDLPVPKGRPIFRQENEGGFWFLGVNQAGTRRFSTADVLKAIYKALPVVGSNSATLICASGAATGLTLS